MMSPMLSREIENFGAAAEKAGPGQHMESFSRMGCESWENVRSFRSLGSAKNVENPRNAILFVSFLQHFRYICTIFRKYNSFSLIFAILRNSCFRKSLRCTPWCAASTMGWSTMGWRWSFGRSASAAPREMTWLPNWMSRTACNYCSAGERCTIFWT